MLGPKIDFPKIHDKIFINKITSFLFLGLILLSTFSAISQVNTYKFTHITVDEGLSRTDAKEVREDSKGFIWIATLFGLDRYDGYRIKRFANNNDPFNIAFKNRIRSL